MDIYNWDMVCAVSCAELNKKLKTASREAFGQFNWSDDEDNKISGEFAGWEIVPGGDSQRINIFTTIRSGKLEATILGKPVNISVDGLCPKLQIELAFVNAGGADKTTHLKFNLARVSKTSSVTAGDGSVVVLSPDTSQLFPASEFIIPQMYCDMMADMLVSMQDKFAFVFAEIMDMPTRSDVSWMKLHLLQYAYNEKINGELGCMAVLGILADNPSPPHPGSLQLIFDTGLIREGGSIGFMLSMRAFMKHVVLPGMPGMFQGSKIKHFLLNDDLAIENNGSIPLNKLDGYTPYINRLNLKVQDGLISLNNTFGRCDVVYDSSFVTFSLIAIFIPRLTEYNGRYTISLSEIGKPIITCQTHDTVAGIFWLLGGFVVDALVQGIRSQIHSLLFEFGYKLSFDVFPITFGTVARYNTCGLAENFYMQD